MEAAVLKRHGKPSEVRWQELARCTVMRGVRCDKARSAKHLVNGLVCCSAACSNGAEKLREPYDAVCCDTHILPI